MTTTTRRPGLRALASDPWRTGGVLLLLAFGVLLRGTPVLWVVLGVVLPLVAGLVAHALLARLEVRPGHVAHRRFVVTRRATLPEGSRLLRVRAAGYGHTSWGTPADHAFTAFVGPDDEVLLRWVGTWRLPPEAIARAAGVSFEDHLEREPDGRLEAVLPWVARRRSAVVLAGAGLLLGLGLGAIVALG